jgi:hypothetical protein
MDLVRNLTLPEIKTLENTGERSNSKKSTHGNSCQKRKKPNKSKSQDFKIYSGLKPHTIEAYKPMKFVPNNKARRQTPNGSFRRNKSDAAGTMVKIDSNAFINRSTPRSRYSNAEDD